MYENGRGVVGIGRVLKPWDKKEYQNKIYYDGDEPEYRIKVDWARDLQEHPLTVSYIKKILGYQPRGAVRRIVKKKKELSIIVNRLLAKGKIRLPSESDVNDLNYKINPVNDWTDEELEISIDAYFEMLVKELHGEPYNKAEANRKLRESELKNRSKGSVEFRMQNISAVLQGLCHPIIKGYLPRGNVGTDVSKRVKEIIFRKKLLREDDYLPTGDIDDLNNKVQAILEKGIIGKPEGQRKPKKQQSILITYERDPLVKAWTIQNANGICELCGKRGPFKDKSGLYYLESHHVVFLSQGGEDTIANTVALCPNCHKRCHYDQDKKAVQDECRKKVKRIA